jgi:hypothetical protein
MLAALHFAIAGKRAKSNFAHLVRIKIDFTVISRTYGLLPKSCRISRAGRVMGR